MKDGTYLLLAGLMLIIRSNGIEGQIPQCKYDDPKTKLAAKCYHKADIEAFDPSQYVPITNLSIHVSNITLQTVYAPKLKWYIDSFDYFTRFDNLTTLQIYGPMNFAQDLLSDDFRKHFLDVPTLKTLHLINNEFNSKDHMWLFPPSIRNLTVNGNDYHEFDLKRYSQLEELHLQHTALSSIPELSKPPPPLNVVNFQNNPLLEITTDDIAWFCDVPSMAFDATNLQKAGQYCECIKIKQWFEKIIKTPEEQVFNKSLICDNSTMPDCPNYSLEKAIENRETCIVMKMTVAPDDEYFASTQYSTSNELYLILGCFITAVVTFGVVYLVTFRYFDFATPPEIDVTEKPEDDIDDKLDVGDDTISLSDGHEHEHDQDQDHDNDPEQESN